MCAAVEEITICYFEIIKAAAARIDNCAMIQHKARVIKVVFKMHIERFCYSCSRLRKSKVMKHARANALNAVEVSDKYGCLLASNGLRSSTGLCTCRAQLAYTIVSPALYLP